MMAMTTLRMMSNDFARLAVRHVRGGEPTNGRQDKSADLGRAHVVGRVRFFGDWTNRADWRLCHKVQGIQRTERRHPPFGGLLLP